MNSHLWRRLKHRLAPAVSVVLLGAIGAVLGTTGVLAAAVGLPLGTDTVCGCSSAPVFEGPSWWVNGSRLGAGATKRLRTTSNTAFKFEALSAKLKCTAAGYAGEIVGSAANNAGTDTGTLTFSGCTVERPTGCEVRGLLNEGRSQANIGEIGPINVETKLVFGKNVRTNAQDLFSSLEKNAAGSPVFTLLKFIAATGETCSLNTGAGLEVKGTVVAELQKAAGADLGPREEETVVRFAFKNPPVTLTESWRPAESIYSGGTAGLTFESEELILSGTMNTELETAEKFGWTNG